VVVIHTSGRRTISGVLEPMENVASGRTTQTFTPLAFVGQRFGIAHCSSEPVNAVRRLDGGRRQGMGGPTL